MTSLVSRRGGWLRGLAWCLVLAVLLTVLGWVFLLPHLVRGRIENTTGFPTALEALTVNPFTGFVRMRELQLTNPEGFADRRFLNLRELVVDLHVTSLAGPELELARLLVDLPEVTVVTAPDGSVNVDVLRRNLDDRSGARPRTGAEQQARKVVVRELVLRIGKLRRVDLREGRESVREVDLALDRTFHDVRGVRDVLVQLADLREVGAFLQRLSEGVAEDALRNAGRTAGQALREAGRAPGKLLDQVLPGARSQDAKP